MSLSTDGSCDVPWGNPPAGQTSNFVDPETLRPAAFGVTLVATAWAVAVSVIRLYVNRKRWMLAECEFAVFCLWLIHLSYVAKKPVIKDFVAIAVVLQPAYCGLVLTRKSAFSVSRLRNASRACWGVGYLLSTDRIARFKSQDGAGICGTSRNAGSQPATSNSSTPK